MDFHTITLFAATKDELTSVKTTLVETCSGALVAQTSEPCPTNVFARTLGGTAFALTFAFKEAGAAVVASIMGAVEQIQATLEEEGFDVCRSAGDRAVAGRIIDQRFLLQ